MTRTDEFAITDDEGATLAKSLNDVLRHYDAVPGFDEKTVDWIMLLQTLGMLYGPRFMVIRAKMKAEQATRPQRPAPRPAPTPEQSGGAPSGGTVIDIPGVPTTFVQ